MRDHLVEKLFSLLTSSDRAEAIAGDLIQERLQRGSNWFWWHVFATTVTLWRIAAIGSPVRTLLLAATAGVLVAVPAFAGVAVVSLFPTLQNPLVIWSLLSFFWWGGALWAGASIVAMAPIRGMVACVMLAAIAEGLLLALLLAGVPLQVRGGASIYFMAASAAVLLLVGGTVAHIRGMPWMNRTPAQQS